MQLYPYAWCEDVCQCTCIYCQYHCLLISYGQSKFTSKPEKYLKYTPEKLEEALNKFFDNGAT